MKNNIKVSVIISTYKRNSILVDAIKSVLKQDFSGFELIVVDQTLKHDSQTEKFIKNLEDPRFLYFKVAPPSLPAARNFSLTKAKGEIVIYIDDDVILDKDFIKSHWLIFRKHNVVAVAGRIREKNKPESDSLHFFRKTGFGAGSFNYSKVAFVETAQGCNMAFKKKVLLEIGGFDTNFIGNAMREESDVAYRLKKKGYKTLFNPKASLLHLMAPTGGCREGKPIYDDYIHFQNEMLFFMRHRPKIFFPYFVAGRLIHYAFTWELIKKGRVFARLGIFSKGMLVGFLVFIHPRKQIIAQEI